MRLKEVLYALGGIALGFIAGFLLANSINRSQINSLKTEIENAGAQSPNKGPTDTALSAEEIRAKITEADQNPANLTYQKNLGLALYRYGAVKNDPEIIIEAARLLERAAGLAPGDRDVTIGLGNAWFDVGYMKKDGTAFSKARTQYERALSKEPNNIDIRTDLGITYFLDDPPNDVKAIDEFKRSLALDPKNEKALEFMIQSLARKGDMAAAQKYLDLLKESHPSNPSIAGLAKQIAAAQ
jgi:tetratricopeptide (TPR) repeat protein